MNSDSYGNLRTVSSSLVRSGENTKTLGKIIFLVSIISAIAFFGNGHTSGQMKGALSLVLSGFSVVIWIGGMLTAAQGELLAAVADTATHTGSCADVLKQKTSS